MSHLKGTVTFHFQLLPDLLFPKNIYMEILIFTSTLPIFRNSLLATLNRPAGQIWPMNTSLPPMVMQHYMIGLHLISIYIYFLPQDCVLVFLAHSDWYMVGASQTSINEGIREDKLGTTVY